MTALKVLSLWTQLVISLPAFLSLLYGELTIVSTLGGNPAVGYESCVGERHLFCEGRLDLLGSHLDLGLGTSAERRIRAIYP